MKHTSQRTASATLLALLLCPVALGQQYKPAVEYQSLMNLRFYEADGGVLVDGQAVTTLPFALKEQTSSFSGSRRTRSTRSRTPLSSRRAS